MVSAVLVYSFVLTAIFILIHVDCHRLQLKNIPIMEPPVNGTSPEQVHISLGNDGASIVVTWNTRNATLASLVRYGLGRVTYSSKGNATVLNNGPGHIQYVHSATMSQLLPNSTYVYQVGSGLSGEMSKIFSFRTVPMGSDWNPRFCVYGDLGYSNAQSLSRIRADVEAGIYDVILHVGDFAYDMDSHFGQTGDKFMRLIEPVASSIPYMATPGNHENAMNFSNYKGRFRMPNNNNGNMFYSYNVGNVHIVSISTEFYFYVEYGLLPMLNQYEWLINELKTANLPENRIRQPWLILVGHRPIYCSNDGGKDCTAAADWLRYGIPGLHILGIEDLIYQYGVDLSIWAHEHTYERMWPVFREKTVNSSTPGEPYRNPMAPVHIVSGSAGCQEDHDTFPRFERPYSAFHSTDYGYSRMTVLNNTHLRFEQVSDDQYGKIIDSILLIREKHEPYTNYIN